MKRMDHRPELCNPAGIATAPAGAVLNPMVSDLLQRQLLSCPRIPFSALQFGELVEWANWRLSLEAMRMLVTYIYVPSPRATVVFHTANDLENLSCCLIARIYKYANVFVNRLKNMRAAKEKIRKKRKEGGA